LAYATCHLTFKFAGWEMIYCPEVNSSLKVS